MHEIACRACRGKAGEVVLDLGEQPACDYFPRCGDPGPDPVYPLSMWLCASCGLAQLVTDPTTPAEPKAAEPEALRAQAADAVQRVASAGLLPAGVRAAEYGSPHGGSWLGLLAERGLAPVGDGEPAEVVLDCFGLMHEADQAAALAARVARLAPGGVMLLQFHSLATIIGRGQWNALRHGHYAYYSATALTAMLAACAMRPFLAWRFSLYGGTVLLAARRDPLPAAGRVPGRGPVIQVPSPPAEPVRSLLAEEAREGVCDPAVLAGLQHGVAARAQALRGWLAAERSAGRTVLGYGAASRAVALLRLAGADRSLLPGVVDASPAKHGLRMPGTDIPVVPPTELAAQRPDSVLLFLPDLLKEVRAAFGGVEAAGGRWVDAEALGSPAAVGGPQQGGPQ